MGNAAAGTAQRKAGADHQWPAADGFGNSKGFACGMCRTGAGHFQIDLLHGFLEKLPVFCPADDLGRSSDHFHIITL